MINASELAGQLKVSRARISQYVSEGKLAGCYSGTGRARRFDPVKCVEALGRRLDAGQMAGNGTTTRKAINLMRRSGAADDLPGPDAAPKGQASELSPTDPDRMDLVKLQLAEEQLRKVRKQNAADEGIYVLASEVQLQVAGLLAQEIAEVEAMLREAAQKIADSLGQNNKVIRQILVTTWREHRAGRAETLSVQADSATMTDAENKEAEQIGAVE